MTLHCQLNKMKIIQKKIHYDAVICIVLQTSVNNFDICFNVFFICTIFILFVDLFSRNKNICTFFKVKRFYITIIRDMHISLACFKYKLYRLTENLWF